MKHFGWCAFLAVACSPRLEGVYESMYPNPTPTEAAVIDVCGRHGALCVPDPTAPKGIIHTGEVDFGGVELRGGVIRYEPETCEADVTLCRFILLHEIGHREEGADQTAADCWAARFASEAEVEAGYELLRKLDEPRAERLKACAR